MFGIQSPAGEDLVSASSSGGNPIPGRRLVASLRHLRRACAGGMSPECAVTPEHRLALAR